MASEYLLNKYKDVRPDPPPEMTPKQRRKNWWYYHKWYVFIGAAALAILGSLIWSALGLGETKPDYQVAYVGTNALPDDTIQALTDGLAALGEDLNGDGQVTVTLHQYTSTGGVDAQAYATAEVTLMADLVACESYFFLLEDPETFQQEYHSLCCLDGSLPEEDDDSVENVVLAWSQCPALAQMELGDYSYELLGQTVTGSSDDLITGLFFARRGFWTEETCLYPEGCAALWDKLTEGAIS